MPSAPVSEPARPLPTPTSSPGPAPVAPADSGTSTGGGGDSASFWDIPGQIREAITGWLADLIRPFVEPLFNTLIEALLTTVNPADQPRISELWEAMRLLATAGYGLFVLAGGLTSMTHGSLQQRWSARDLLPRLVLGIAASNLSLTICSTTVELTNALAWAIFGNGVNAHDVAGTLVGLLLAQLTNTAAPYLVVIQLVATTLGATLLITVLLRTAAIDVLTVAAPLMLACHAHPASDAIARLWWRAYLGCMATEVAQAIALLVCVKALLDPDNYGLVPSDGSTPLLNLLLLCCALYLLIKIPSWIRRIVTTPARAITGSTQGPRLPGLRVLRKVALGALGMSLGPYAFGAHLAGRVRGTHGTGAAAFRAARGGAGGPRHGRGGPRRSHPGGPGPGPAAPPGGPPPPPPPPPGGGHPGPPPGRPSSPGYRWGRPRRRTANNHLDTQQPPTTPALPPTPPAPPPTSGGTGPAQPPPSGPRNTNRTPPSPGPPPPPPPAVRPTAAANLRPARANLPPALPRPAPLRPPLDNDPPPKSRRGRRPR
ncbi:hypothetical protein OG455_34700 [Kitasatospora sp. NBC_01287]|uniref:hypothetical protein n=1 Tax=Kitasatospora sp. NBC_01287 TaxID=2903573 RepID=UPI00225004F1|nr:hypothetical protein [Kitasatospora sp. NBC_01287]MCX4750600.1 hypothetical protein [Kitasatospora sp. NBC_01287]